VNAGGLRTLALTAARSGFSPPPHVVADRLAALPEFSRYVTGAASGGDAWLGQWLAARYPAAKHVVIVPADRSQVDPWWGQPRWAGRVSVVEMAPGTSYAMRNAALVHWGDELAGFPAWPERAPGSQRSGSWQTIRMAQKAEKPVRWQCVMPPHAGSWPPGPQE
jgi:hypothetical protein